MGFFSRDKEAIESGPAADVPFETLRRQPRNTKNAAKNARNARDSRFDAPPPLDPTEAAKTRARRRLIGAVAIALAAIVFVPMLFDRTPPPTADDIALQIPDRDTPFEGRRGVPDSTRGPLKASTELPVQPAATGVAPPVQSTPSTPPPEAVEKPAERPVEKVAERPAEKPAEKLAEKSTEVDVKPAPKVAATPPADQPKPTDDPRALAALEGKPDAALGSTGKTFAVQIAAFSAADKARGLRDQLVANGMKSYTESVSTTEGLRTRVRLGPFATREAADRAKEKLKTMKLDGAVVPL